MTRRQRPSPKARAKLMRRGAPMPNVGGKPAGRTHLLRDPKRFALAYAAWRIRTGDEPAAAAREALVVFTEERPRARFLEPGKAAVSLGGLPATGREYRLLIRLREIQEHGDWFERAWLISSEVALDLAVKGHARAHRQLFAAGWSDALPALYRKLDGGMRAARHVLLPRPASSTVLHDMRKR